LARVIGDDNDSKFAIRETKHGEVVSSWLDREKTDMNSRPPNGDNLLFSTSEQAVYWIVSRIFSREENCYGDGSRTEDQTGTRRNRDVQRDEISRKRGAKLGEATR